VLYELDQWEKKGVEGHFLPDKLNTEQGSNHSMVYMIIYA